MGSCVYVYVCVRVFTNLLVDSGKYFIFYLRSLEVERRRDDDEYDFPRDRERERLLDLCLRSRLRERCTRDRRSNSRPPT